MTLRLGEIVINCTEHETVVAFWLEAMGDYARIDVNEQYVAIAPAEPSIGRPAILFLGATSIAERMLDDALRWTVMADPEGNEFCVSGER